MHEWRGWRRAAEWSGGVEEAQASRAAQCSGAGVMEGAGGTAEVCALRRQTAAAQASDGCRRARRPWTGDSVGAGWRWRSGGGAGVRGDETEMGGSEAGGTGKRDMTYGPPRFSITPVDPTLRF